MDEIKEILRSLISFFEKYDFKGWDPFDGLNSKLFQSTPLKRSRFFRLAWLQFFKRSPINLRPLMLVPKEQNPKGLGLILSGYCNLYWVDKNKEYLQKISYLSNRIIELKSEGYSGSCWGYNFDWQARAFFQPKWTPTIVATTFISYALLDTYEITRDDRLLKEARSSCDFILNDLNRSKDGGDFAFSYSPLDNTDVYNASFLGARLLSRVYSFTKENHLIEAAQKVINYCVKRQNKNGSWAYSSKDYHHWIDSFHTGYNLEGLFEYMRYSGDTTYKSNFDKGLDYYLNTFFLKDGTPKYYSNSTFPIDIHSPSQLIVTLCRSEKLDINSLKLGKVINWTINNMYSEKKKYFFYQKNRWGMNKINYQRWVQADIFFSLSLYLKKIA